LKAFDETVNNLVERRINNMRVRIFARALLIGTLVCSGSLAGVTDAQRAQGININKVTLGTEYVNGEARGGYGGSIFRPGDHAIYCVVGLTNPAPEATFKFVWLAYDPAQRKSVEIFEQEVAHQPSNLVAGKLSSPRDWPIGGYTVEVYIDGRLKKRLTFMIKKYEE
jgi:hypothetical protein